MKKHKIKSLLFVSIFTSATLLTNTLTFADTDELQSEIDSNNDKLDELEEEKKAVESEINNISIELDDVMDQIIAKSNQIYDLEVEINQYTSEINSKISEIDDTNLQIETKEKEIITKENELIDREDMINNRVRTYYKTDMSLEFINLILDSGSFADILFTFNSINTLLNTDKDMMDRLESARIDLENSKSELETLLTNLENDKVELQGIQASLESTKETYESEMASLEDLESQKQIAIANLTEEEKNLASSINDLNDENAALEAKIQDLIRQNSTMNNAPENFQGEFLRPVPGAITSHFGYRTHPVTGLVNSFHKGIDYGSGFGTPILAAKSGKVIFAGVNGGYGNCIIIDHGDGSSTLYAHNQNNYVSYGQTVSQGETIGTVGSSGRSTGPHLHFEIRINGDPVDPYSYIPF